MIGHILREHNDDLRLVHVQGSTVGGLRRNYGLGGSTGGLGLVGLGGLTGGLGGVGLGGLGGVGVGGLGGVGLGGLGGLGVGGLGGVGLGGLGGYGGLNTGVGLGQQIRIQEINQVIGLSLGFLY